MKLFSIQGIKFNNDSNCSIDGESSVQIKNQITLRIRFKLLEVNNCIILNKDGEYKIGTDNGKLYFSVFDGTDWNPNVICNNIESGNWYDVICLINVGSTISKVVYVNNVNNRFEESSQSGSISQTTNNLIIGNYDIVVDNFMFWSRLLEDYEIDSIFNGGVVFNNLDFWIAFEDINNDNNKTKEIIYKRYYGVLNGDYEIVNGKEYENILNSNNKVVVVKRY